MVYQHFRDQSQDSWILLPAIRDGKMKTSEGVKADLSHTEINKKFVMDFKRNNRAKYTDKGRTLRRASRKKRKEKNKARYIGREKSGLRKGKKCKRLENRRKKS